MISFIYHSLDVRKVLFFLSENISKIVICSLFEPNPSANLACTLYLAVPLSNVLGSYSVFLFLSSFFFFLSEVHIEFLCHYCLQLFQSLDMYCYEAAFELSEQKLKIKLVWITFCSMVNPAHLVDN